MRAKDLNEPEQDWETDRNNMLLHAMWTRKDKVQVQW